jgi:hypothetical protein
MPLPEGAIPKEEGPNWNQISSLPVAPWVLYYVETGRDSGHYMVVDPNTEDINSGVFPHAVTPQALMGSDIFGERDYSGHPVQFGDNPTYINSSYLPVWDEIERRGLDVKILDYVPMAGQQFQVGSYIIDSNGQDILVSPADLVGYRQQILGFEGLTFDETQNQAKEDYLRALIEQGNQLFPDFEGSVDDLTYEELEEIYRQGVMRAWFIDSTAFGMPVTDDTGNPLDWETFQSLFENVDTYDMASAMLQMRPFHYAANPEGASGENFGNVFSEDLGFDPIYEMFNLPDGYEYELGHVSYPTLVGDTMSLLDESLAGFVASEQLDQLRGHVDDWQGESMAQHGALSTLDGLIGNIRGIAPIYGISPSSVADAFAALYGAMDAIYNDNTSAYDYIETYEHERAAHHRNEELLGDTTLPWWMELGVGFASTTVGGPFGGFLKGVNLLMSVRDVLLRRDPLAAVGFLDEIGDIARAGDTLLPISGQMGIMDTSLFQGWLLPDLGSLYRASNDDWIREWMEAGLGNPYGWRQLQAWNMISNFDFGRVHSPWDIVRYSGAAITHEDWGTQRWLDLSGGKPRRWYEGNTALNIESRYGVILSPLSGETRRLGTGTGDWIVNTAQGTDNVFVEGATIDGVTILPEYWTNPRFARAYQGLGDSIQAHLMANKADVIVIDVSRLSPEQISEVQAIYDAQVAFWQTTRPDVLQDLGNVVWLLPFDL